MRKIFHFDAPREPYKADAAVVWCFDQRFDLVFTKFLKRIGITSADPIKIAGGAQSLAGEAAESDRDFIVNQIRTSIKLHETRRVILMLHSDCGAYGGLKQFGGDPIAEAEHHARDLEKAADYLRKVIPDISVDCYFVDFAGVWEPDLQAAQGKRE